MPQFDMGVEVIDAVKDFHGTLRARKGEECQGSVACCTPVALAVLVVTGCAGVMDPTIAHCVLPLPSATVEHEPQQGDQLPERYTDGQHQEEAPGGAEGLVVALVRIRPAGAGHVELGVGATAETGIGEGPGNGFGEDGFRHGFPPFPRNAFSQITVIRYRGVGRRGNSRGFRG
jgi:hypothetical protein